MTHARPTAWVLATFTGLLAGLTALPGVAAACGGTFCDNLPDPMPVDQAGEDILFVRDGTEIEVHVRIQYEGEAARFAWVVPVQDIPQVAVGSDALFNSMAQLSAPRWQTTVSYECEEDDPSFESDDGLTFVPESDLSSASEPDIVLEDTVGAFDVVVLQGGTAQEVIDFLDANDYAQDPDAEPILQDYIDEGFLIAAVKLSAGSEVNEIHPLSFRFTGDEPCVPLRLTAIAAEEDMGVRAYFLDSARWAPSNYEHVVLNPLAFGWGGGSLTNYVELLSLAADEAGGRAFATDYAGTSPAPNTGIYDPSWNESAYLGLDPIEALDTIVQQDLNLHPLVRTLLAEFIPPPDGVDPTDFWSNIEGYADQIDLDAWDDVAFSEALAERIIVPGMHAADLLDAWPYLTRLHTTISPAEMTLDPTFHRSEDLPPVESAVITSSQILCGGDQVYDVAFAASEEQGGDQLVPVCRPQGATYPDFLDMPAALRVEQIPEMGPAQVVLDNSADILAAHTAQQAGASCESNPGGDGGDSGDEIGDDESGNEDGSYDLPYDVTCGCTSEGGNEAPVGVALGLLVLGLLGTPRRRRR